MPQAESRSRTTTTEKKMVEGVRKARKVQAAAQRTAHVKTRRLIASTEDLERFEAMLVRNDCPGQCACTMYVLRNYSQSKFMTSHNSSGSERTKTQPIVRRQVVNALPTVRRQAAKQALTRSRTRPSGNKSSMTAAAV